MVEETSVRGSPGSVSRGLSLQRVATPLPRVAPPRSVPLACSAHQTSFAVHHHLFLVEPRA
jgi:hypothetical protein